ncbi:MAG: metallophosphoesterase, partial [Candidatus Aenigmatarchaeota archaeon]
EFKRYLKGTGYEDMFIMLRGNHEAYAMQSFTPYDFPTKLNNPTLLSAYQDLFANMPIAAYTDDGYLLVHGGIPNGAKSLDDLASYELGVLWNDPSDTVTTFGPSARGVGNTYGEQAVDDFLGTTNIKGIIRSHETVADGYKVSFDGKVTTIFSSNYGGRINPKYAVIENGKAQITDFSGNSVKTIDPPAVKGSGGVGTGGKVLKTADDFIFEYPAYKNAINDMKLLIENGKISTDVVKDLCENGVEGMSRSNFDELFELVIKPRAGNIIGTDKEYGMIVYQLQYKLFKSVDEEIELVERAIAMEPDIMNRKYYNDYLDAVEGNKKVRVDPLDSITTRNSEIKIRFENARTSGYLVRNEYGDLSTYAQRVKLAEDLSNYNVVLSADDLKGAKIWSSDEVSRLASEQSAKWDMTNEGFEHAIIIEFPTDLFVTGGSKQIFWINPALDGFDGKKVGRPGLLNKAGGIAAIRKGSPVSDGTIFHEMNHAKIRVLTRDRMNVVESFAGSRYLLDELQGWTAVGSPNVARYYIDQAYPLGLSQTERAIVENYLKKSEDLAAKLLDKGATRDDVQRIIAEAIANSGGGNSAFDEFLKWDLPDNKLEMLFGG